MINFKIIHGCDVLSTEDKVNIFLNENPEIIIKDIQFHIVNHNKGLNYFATLLYEKNN